MRGSATRTRCGVAAAVALSSLAAAGPAQAATARVTSGIATEGRGYPAETAVVNFDAAAGERNRLTVSVSGQTATLVDPAGIQPLARCSRPNASDPTRVACDLRGTGRTDVVTERVLPGADIKLGDGDDSATVPILGDDAQNIGERAAELVIVDGGAGNDTIASAATSRLSGSAGEDELRASDRASSLLGGSGGDRLIGGPNDDIFVQGPGPDGADTMRGGRGFDVASYSERRGAVRADLAGDADDGERGERDRIGRDVNALEGGARGDRLSGNRSANTLRGGDGRDRLNGRRGSDRVSGGAGADRIRARDGATDSIRCGRGRDAAAIDGLDLATGCERASRSARARALLDPDGYLYADNVRSLVATLACPRDGPRRCRGRVRVSGRGRTLGAARFSIRRGGTRDLTIRLRSAAQVFRGRSRWNLVFVIRTRGRGRVRSAVSIPSP